MSDDKKTRKVISSVKDGAVILRPGCQPLYMYPTPENMKNSNDVVLMLEFFQWCQDNKGVVEDFIREYLKFQKEIEVEQQEKERAHKKGKLRIVSDEKDLDKE